LSGNRIKGLNVSARSVDYFSEVEVNGRLTVGLAVEFMEQLKRTITWEMQERLFILSRRHGLTITTEQSFLEKRLSEITNRPIRHG
jgi:hypothetical protein